MNRLKLLGLMVGSLISTNSYASTDSIETKPKSMDLVDVNTNLADDHLVAEKIIRQAPIERIDFYFMDI